MKSYLLAISLFICSLQMFHGQEDNGVVSLALPVRNSLTFNRYAINPTFSFVREQTKFVTVTNKREWVQFEDAPLTYLASYSGRFGENIGAGLGLFQQNYGVLTTFGGVLNFAYNAVLGRDSNLTFGLNIGAYKSGVNTGNVVTNFDDPALQNVPENFLLTINPGINYGTEFLDFGLSINNLALYNFESSTLIEDDPEQGIQGHIMYTGYMDSRGFFDESKFSGLVRSEFRQDNTVISGLAMITVPKGIWAQVGYNTLYGASAGIGINLTKQIALEYNYEKPLGDLVDFGQSHEISLAYRFINNKSYDYSREDDVSGIFSNDNRRRYVSRRSKPKSDTSPKKETTSKIASQEQEKKKEAEALEAERRAKEEADALAQEQAEADAKAEEQARIAAEQKAKEEAEAKLEAERLAKAKEEARAKIAAQQKAEEEAELEREKQLAEAKAKKEAEEKAQAEAEAKRLAALEAEKLAQEKLELEEKAKAEAEAKRLAEEAAEKQRLADLEAQAQFEAEQKAIADAEAKANEALIENPKTEIGKDILAASEEADALQKAQDELLKQFNKAVEVKNENLKELKEENDLSEQGIAVEPKPFRSVTAENNALKAAQVQLDENIKLQESQLSELKSLYEEAREGTALTNEEVLLFYKKKIDRLTAEQAKAVKAKIDLEVRLETIKERIEFEKRRRIKRAKYDNEEDRYAQDRSVLNSLKQNTPLAEQPYKEDDFDFGEEQSNNIQILKNLPKVENGYYLIIAVHSDERKRDDFLKKVIASGRRDVDFFYDVKTSKYYIYYKKAQSINEANSAMETKGDRPYNGRMSIVKIEN